ncbi:MAG: helix-turn-helix transcriptional regulator [Methanomassiliicoccales archaeon]|nr:helix-turn-helix transcriptional regulator [Methanomassiliicoccales archaeon]
MGEGFAVRDAKFICPVEATLSMIGGKWKSIILWRLNGRTIRFNQLMAELPMISPKMLTKQLRELEKDGLVSRTMYPEIPPRVEYSLTPLGMSIEPILCQLSQWGIEHLSIKVDTGECPLKRSV